MRNKLPYKLPTICRCKSGEWYLQYAYEYPEQPGRYKTFKVKDGINRIHDPKLKEMAARELQADITYWLEVLNYNPFEEKKDIIKQAMAEIKAKSTPPHWTLSEAIDRFKANVVKKNLSKRTKETYDNYLSNLIAFLNEFPDHDVPANSFTEFDLISFLDVESDELDWSPRTYNNYIGFYQTFFNTVNKLEKAITRNIKYEFSLTGDEYKTSNSQKNKAYSGELKTIIKEELVNNQNLSDYIEWIYLSLMRPAEIRALRFIDIDKSKRQIRIIGKTGDRIIPISDQLLNLIKKRQHRAHTINDFVFGMAGEVSAIQIGRDYFPEKYAVIKKQLGLDHNYTLYAWKHTGVIDMIYAGFSDRDIMILSGHKTETAFAAYKRDLIINENNVMKGATINF
ncbi:tyrosine-type recombinase/integrase [Mucilaginibacter gossypii]|uniref:site-specific integrase n=1 Tax=Mucilaginibacter gossypii TaxID=551996 RepID=UPI00101A6E74|nr:tyrosine-type recombinase/integrase [Mucilaginibacter gossypii]QTE37459.1 tyrosine-type recombinase/integrase [Mucilaginibacter gossypii]